MQDVILRLLDTGSAVIVGVAKTNNLGRERLVRITAFLIVFPMQPLELRLVGLFEIRGVQRFIQFLDRLFLKLFGDRDVSLTAFFCLF